MIIKWFLQREVNSLSPGFLGSLAVLGCTLLLFRTTALAEVQVHLNQGEFDQSIVEVVGPASSGSGSLYVTQKYIEQYKLPLVGASAAPKTEFFINDGDFVINLAAYPAADKVKLTNSETRPEGIIFVFMVNGKVDAYLYKAREKSVERLPEYRGIVGENRIRSSIDASKGLTVYIPADNRSSIWLKIPTGDADEYREILLQQSNDGVQLGIADSKVVGDRLYAVGVGRASASERDSFIWSVSIQYKGGTHTKYHTHTFKTSGAIQASYIQNDAFGTHFVTEIQPIPQGNFNQFRPIPAQTLLFDESMKIVWEGEAFKVSQPRPFKIVGICQDKYAVIHRKIEEEMRNVMAVEVISKSGVAVQKFDHTLLDTGKVTKLFVQAFGDSLLELFTNYHQWEAQRRKDGLYGWRGYLIDRYSVNCNTVK